MIILVVMIGLPVLAWPPGPLTEQTGNGARVAAQSADEELSLEPGKPIERELSGGQSHFYKITMTSDQYLHIVIEQRGINVAVALFTPNGKKISEENSNPVIEGSEAALTIAEITGEYMVKVHSPDKAAKTGRYEIKVEALRAATVEDKFRIAAESVFREAEQLEKGTLEEKRKGIEKYHEALELYRRASYRNGEADTLQNIGAGYHALGETQKALEKYNEDLPIIRAVGDRREEVTTLNTIGQAYQSLGETQKALEKHNEALPISRTIGDPLGEAVTLLCFGAIYQSLGETQKALEKYNEALLLMREVGNRYEESVALLRIARVEQKRGNLTQARQTIEQAVSLVESQSTNITGQGGSHFLLRLAAGIL
jgi:tetratricopeptide (TPR) repeat protein